KSPSPGLEGMIHFVYHESLWGQGWGGYFGIKAGCFPTYRPKRACLRTISEENSRTGSRGAQRSEPQLREALCERGAPLGAAGTIAERADDSGVLWYPLGAAVDGTIELQSFVPLVRRAFAG